MCPLAHFVVLLDTLTLSAIDVAAVADLLAGMLAKPPVFTVAAILLKRGIDTLCS